jgi:deoxyribonuclease V
MDKRAQVVVGNHQHRWNISPKEAIQIQKELRTQVLVTKLDQNKLNLIAGVDVGLLRRSDDSGATLARAAIVVLDYATMSLVEQSTAEITISFPYVPGLLSFREMPVILAAIQKLTKEPDVFLVDGHGYAHPRRFGLACHLGVWLDKPAIGCGKSILIGEPDPLDNQRGCVAALRDAEETIGKAVRTRDGVKPVFISVGHRIDLDSAVHIVLNCGRGVRLPEPIRWAHRLASS